MEEIESGYSTQPAKLWVGNDPTCGFDAHLLRHMITIAVPILNRPERIEDVLRRFEGFDVLFLPDRTDEESIRELGRTGAQYSFAHNAEAFGVPTFATKVNHAYSVSDNPFIFYGSDDIYPSPVWWDVAKVTLEDGNIGVLGAYDGLRKYSQHKHNATHGIVRRTYVEHYGSASLPDAGPLFWEGYRHACVDVELTGVARSRGAYYFDPQVTFEHIRPTDSTMLLGESYLEEDRARMRKRAMGWSRKG